jgi:CRISPR-associated protein Cas5h
LIKGEFGFFKKPDINDIYLTIICFINSSTWHIGSYCRVAGISEKWCFSSYYERLKHLKIGIKPLNDDKGNFSKIW